MSWMMKFSKLSVVVEFEYIDLLCIVFELGSMTIILFVL